MSNETGGSDGGPASEGGGESAAQAIGERVFEILSASKLLPPASGRFALTPSDLGRVVKAFAQIRDPRLRSEFIGLIEAIGSSATR